MSSIQKMSEKVTAVEHFASAIGDVWGLDSGKVYIKDGSFRDILDGNPLDGKENMLNATGRHIDILLDDLRGLCSREGDSRMTAALLSALDLYFKHPLLHGGALRTFGDFVSKDCAGALRGTSIDKGLFYSLTGEIRTSLERVADSVNDLFIKAAMDSTEYNKFYYLERVMIDSVRERVMDLTFANATDEVDLFEILDTRKGLQGDNDAFYDKLTECVMRDGMGGYSHGFIKSLYIGKDGSLRAEIVDFENQDESIGVGIGFDSLLGVNYANLYFTLDL